MKRNPDSLEAIASQCGATQEDIERLTADFPEWVTRRNGVLYPSDGSQDYVNGFLSGAALWRAEDSIPGLDRRLARAYDALTNHPKMPRAAADQAAWQAAMLRLFSEVTDALVALVDAKAMTGRMSRSRAASIRTEASQLQREAKVNVVAALRRAVRVARV